MEQERDELLRRQTETFLDMQQKIGLKELLLERKMAALTEGVDKTEAQLYGSLSASNVDPTTAGSAANKLKVSFQSVSDEHKRFILQKQVRKPPRFCVRPVIVQPGILRPFETT